MVEFHWWLNDYALLVLVLVETISVIAILALCGLMWGWSK